MEAIGGHSRARLSQRIVPIRVPSLASGRLVDGELPLDLPHRMVSASRGAFGGIERDLNTNLRVETVKLLLQATSDQMIAGSRGHRVDAHDVSLPSWPPISRRLRFPAHSL